MATTATAYYPYDAGAGANITESQWRTMMGNICQSGVVDSYLNELSTTGDSTGMQVKIATGGAWINGAYGENTSGVQTIAIDASHATLNRYDLIVARNNYTTNVIEWDVIKGTNGASPTVPTVTVDTTKYEIALAYVYIAATVTTINAADVTDQRSWTQATNEVTRRRILTVASDTITIDNLPTRKYIEITFVGLNSGQISPALRFNNDSGSNYATRGNTDGGADGTAVSQTSHQLATATTSNVLAEISVVNISTQEKLFLANAMRVGTTGAGNAPGSNRQQGKWANTTDPITQVNIINGGTGDFAIGTELIIRLKD